jgi:acetylornithine/N-succinyldiaminopimelate aminotransferase
VNVPPPGFLQQVRELCTRHGALLIVDEIQTGVGRTGAWFCHQHDRITPDIMTLAKGLGGGVPIGAVVLGGPTAELLKPGMHGTTFGGNHLAMAAGIAVMSEIASAGLVENARARGEQLVAGLKRAFPDAVAVRGRGLLLGVQLPAGQTPAALVKAGFTEGIVVGPSGNNTVRLAPPLTISAAQIDELLSGLMAARKRL